LATHSIPSFPSTSPPVRHRVPSHFNWTLLLYLFTHSDTNTHTFSVGLLWTSDRAGAETSTWTTHNIQRRRTAMPPAGSKSAITANQQPQTPRPPGTAVLPTAVFNLCAHVKLVGLCTTRSTVGNTADVTTIKPSSGLHAPL